LNVNDILTGRDPVLDEFFHHSLTPFRRLRQRILSRRCTK
jgi:hypothetical protein